MAKHSSRESCQAAARAEEEPEGIEFGSARSSASGAWARAVGSSDFYFELSVVLRGLVLGQGPKGDQPGKQCLP